MSEQMDTFANPTPVTVVDAAQTTAQDAGIDTFDNPEPILPETEVKEDTKGEEQEQAEEKSSPEKPKTEGQTGKLDQQEKEDESDEDEEDSDGGDEKKDGEDKEPEGEGDNEEKVAPEQPKGKTVRLKEGDSKYDISLEATVPVKVKGKKEFVSLQELRDNYSGQKVWSDEIAQVREQNKQHEETVAEFQESKEATKQHFAKIGGMLEDAFSNPEADPLAAMKYLVDLSGRDVLQFEQRLMNHFSEVAGQFSEMDESEQALYWTRRENDILRNNQSTLAKTDEERRAIEQRNLQTAKVREQYGISETDFDATRDEIESLGYDMKEVSEEQVAKWAALKPYAAKAEELCGQFEEDLSTDELNSLISGATEVMYQNPKMNDIDCLHFAAKKLGFKIETEDDLVSDLKEKATTQKPPKAKSAKSTYRYGKDKDESQVESFDDFDNDIYARR